MGSTSNKKTKGLMSLAPKRRASSHLKGMTLEEALRQVDEIDDGYEPLKQTYRRIFEGLPYNHDDAINSTINELKIIVEEWQKSPSSELVESYYVILMSLFGMGWNDSLEPTHLLPEDFMMPEYYDREWLNNTDSN